MSYARTYRSQGGTFHDNHRSSFSRSNNNNDDNYNTNIFDNRVRNYNNPHDFSRKFRDHINNFNYVKPNAAPSLKRRKFSSSAWEGCGSLYQQPNTYDSAPSTCNSSFPAPARVNANAYTSTSCKRDRSKWEDDEVVFMSRDEIERCSPSRKDGIDALREAHLRYSYCAFIQNLGLRLELPQTTIGTAMVLCHRFFVRRSHACHDRFLIATAALFLAAKSEESPRPLNNVLRASCEISHKQDLTFLSYLLPVDWFEQYRERVIEAEQMILTTLDFELNVQHPYVPLTSILNKIGLSQSVLVNLALNLLSEGIKELLEPLQGCCIKILKNLNVAVCYVIINFIQTNFRLRSSLWLQFKPHHIAAGAAYLAAKFLNWDLAAYQNIWQEFQTTPAILQDVAQQLMELF